MKEIFYDWLGYNAKIFHFLNHEGNIGLLPKTLSYLSFFFNIENFAIYYVIGCLVFMTRIYSSPLIRGSQESCEILGSSPKSSLEENNKKTYNLLIFIGICYAIFGLTYAAIKFSINFPRPYCSISPELFQTILDLSHERCLSSFPSSHSGLALIVTILAWSYLGVVSRIFAVVTTALVAWSRIALAMHYPADILYSYMIVILVICSSRLVFRVFEGNIIKWLWEYLASSGADLRGSQESDQTLRNLAKLLPREITYQLNSEADTNVLAGKLASELKAGDLVTLHGDLGAGKTFLAREIIRFLCGDETNVPSPTFNILQVYQAPNFKIYHYDLYRLKSHNDLYELGFEDALDGNLCLIEWPEIAAGILPSGIEVHLEIDGEARVCRVKGICFPRA
jgi:tRNA threonylcarbamoyl adenosine modification protein YjeE